MPRKSTEQKKLEEVLSDLVFIPTAGQRKVKAKYWLKSSGLKFTDMGPDLPQIQRVVREKRLPDWWQIPGFKEWFRNEEEFRERVEYITNLALDAIEEVLRDTEAKGTTRIAAAKLALDVGDKMPKNDIQVFSDAKINQMDASELEAYIEANTPKQLPIVVDISTEEKEDEPK